MGVGIPSGFHAHSLLITEFIREVSPLLPSLNTHRTHPLGPLGPLGFNSPNIAQRHALHVERTAEKAFMLSDRV